MVITVSCPACSASFPVDSNKIPVAGVSVRCSSCSYVFRIERPEEQAPPPEPMFEAEPEAVFQAEPESEAEPETEPEPDPFFETPTFDEPMVETSESDFSFGQETPAPSDDETGWVLERDEDINPGDLTIDPMETVESSVEDAKADQPIVDEFDGPDLADPMALPAEPADAFFAEATPEPEPEPESDAPVVTGFSFGKRDPKDKARRLARVLVSDMISYNPDRHERALANGSIKEDFEEEIQKSWKEYVDQVGEEMANENPFWVEALNDVLAKGEQIF